MTESVTAVTTNRRESFVADSLASGLVIMLLMTVVQRGIGFFRGVWLCRLLDDTVVGQWSMALGFITMLTPLMMLGFCGAMPRFVERYRLAGQLPKFLSRVLLGTLIGSVLVMLSLLLAPETVGWIIFREASSSRLLFCVGVAVSATLVFNFVMELVSSLRQVRTASLMQFLQGVGFTFIGLGILYAGGGLGDLILSYALSTMIATLPGARLLYRDWSGLPSSDEEFNTGQMWRSLLPYAAALWVMNLLTNSFELADRYMILHFVSGGEEAATAAVGQYHSGRLIPMLVTSLATMFSGVLMPYLTADWEAGRFEAVQQRLSRTLFGLSLAFTACAAITIGVSPLFFETLLQGRYSEGLAIQPMAFTFCIWAATVTVAQNYLWIRERGALMGWSLAAGLIANFILNYWWLPIHGLYGAVAATLVANAVVMLGTGFTMVRIGYQFDTTLIWVAAMPLTLMTDWRIALAISIAAVLLHRQAQQWTLEALQAVRFKLPNVSADAT